MLPAHQRLSTLSQHLAMQLDGTDFEYDLVTLGAGSGGVRASRVSSATYGAKVGQFGRPVLPITRAPTTCPVIPATQEAAAEGPSV